MLKTGSVPYRVTEVAEGPSPATATFLTITAMPAYLSKSMEELRHGGMLRQSATA
ncbi:hypothetical protein HaLaN_12375 [Haematococcus lacustris]|uniref:Uncharacterized protein n=1 Tax=Haematococcus lacustris TaxID=44745 RepID=A0A699Z1X4_HAELA|nr:hypothetical protein HaLaN_12375 [Haematococcus lacustris]